MNRPRLAAMGLAGMVLISVLSLAYSTTALAQARVVTSIKPLQMIASAVTDGVSEPALLIPPHQSYHHFVLRPSTVRAVRGADLLVWVGPQLETYLADTVARSPSSARVLEVLALSDLRIHQTQAAAPDSAAPAGEQEHEHHHEHGEIDAHVWLDTHNGELVANAIADALVQIDPDHATAYEANRQRFVAALTALRGDIGASLRMPAGAAYAVYHDAFQYFEREFGLQHELVLVESEELQPSVRHMVEVRNQIAATSLLCLLEDVTSQPAVVRTLLGNHAVPRIQVDTTGRELDSGADSYLQLIQGVADAFRQCFSQ